ncbi:unnamed protein product [Vitrella brassicaformis CCMP3155]|uniref:ribonuclease H n=1 Tax=Vitrella brassicaformis (strain CCMP3155) TaxID=1169540 RepID=A0A0G4EUR4_VITBC|nr:unnamed protein product [Vitrella brassicaformis CCMP3155]|eukprot:CEM02071.1 unnamed protein product [Vitrella brassicaformis CCMP3155]
MSRTYTYSGGRTQTQKASKFYAVANSPEGAVGIYTSWGECKNLVKDENDNWHKSAKMKSFTSRDEAEKWMDQNAGPNWRMGTSDGGSATASHGGPIRPDRQQYRQGPYDKAGGGGGSAAAAGSTTGLRHGSAGPNAIEVYSDGACENNGKPNAMAGWGVWFGQGDDKNCCGRMYGKQTNQRAELFAAVKALELCRDSRGLPVRLFTDSQYTIKCVSEWIQRWRSNGWKNANKDPVSNQDLVKTLDALIRERNGFGMSMLEMVHVKGHSGNEGNDKADELAVIGTQLPEPTLEDPIIAEMTAMF